MTIRCLESGRMDLVFLGGDGGSVRDEDVRLKATTEAWDALWMEQ